MADTIVPGGGFDPQGLNRYMYVRGNPLRYVEPSGHNYKRFDKYYVTWVSKSTGWGKFAGPSYSLRPWSISTSSELFTDNYTENSYDITRFEGSSSFVSGAATLRSGISVGDFNFGELKGTNDFPSITEGFDIGVDIQPGIIEITKNYCVHRSFFEDI